MQQIIKHNAKFLTPSASQSSIIPFTEDE